jgi:hypothetical protein
MCALASASATKKKRYLTLKLGYPANSQPIPASQAAGGAADDGHGGGGQLCGARRSVLAEAVKMHIFFVLKNAVGGNQLI